VAGCSVIGQSQDIDVEVGVEQPGGQFTKVTGTSGYAVDQQARTSGVLLDPQVAAVRIGNVADLLVGCHQVLMGAQVHHVAAGGVGLLDPGA